MPERVHPEPRTVTRRDLLRAAAVLGIAPVGVADATAETGNRHLRVHGSVANPVRLSRADLHRLGGERLTAVLECARSGAAREATWTGIPLQAVLDRAGIRGDAVAVVATGDDGHRRALPLRDIRLASPLIAWERDGAALTSPRLLVPGWAGEASVKRLVSIEVVDRIPVESTTADPADRRLRPLREMPPRAVIVAPAAGETVAAGRRVIDGVAWSGYAPIASVAVTIDGGETWRAAAIVARSGPLGWARFAVAWDAVPGPALLAARATDSLGLTQPIDVTERARAFARNVVVTIAITVS